MDVLCLYTNCWQCGITETASSETSNKARQIYYMATKQSIEHKGITFKHGLNVGRNIGY